MEEQIWFVYGNAGEEHTTAADSQTCYEDQYVGRMRPTLRAPTCEEQASKYNKKNANTFDVHVYKDTNSNLEYASAAVLWL